MRNIFKRRKNINVDAEAEVITSCEDQNTLYLEFTDGLRLIFRDGKYVGHYIP